MAPPPPEMPPIPFTRHRHHIRTGTDTRSKQRNRGSCNWRSDHCIVFGTTYGLSVMLYRLSRLFFSSNKLWPGKSLPRTSGQAYHIHWIILLSSLLGLVMQACDPGNGQAIKLEELLLI
jgi:hypothetical protein